MIKNEGISTVRYAVLPYIQYMRIRAVVSR